MSPLAGAIVGIAAFLVLSFHGLPVAFSFAVVGCMGLICLRGLESGLSILGHIPFSWGTESALLPLPLFVLMGQIAFYSDISRDLYQTAYRWLGRLPGGIAVATNIAATGFAACCGVSMAGAATMASIAYPEMEKLNYDRRLATGCIVAGGGLSSLIPPSLGFIIFGFLTETSIAQLFIAGIFPGLLTSLMFTIGIIVMCKRNPLLGPSGPSYSWGEKFLSLKGVWAMLVLFLTFMCGLYAGVFTPSEAGSAGAFGAFVIALVTRRMKLSGFIMAAKDALRISCFIMTMIIGANVFNVFLGVTGLTSEFSQWLTGLEINRFVILSGILAAYIPLGMFLDIGAVILLTIPIVVPPLVSLGFDVIWLGVLIIFICEIGFMTPPVGLNAFVVNGVTGVHLAEIFRGVTPFVFMMLLTLVLLVIFPQISLFLPSIIDR
ncbi:MAG: TRAP transporter large permease [Thermodesulfobacteriota bacterium]